jgi:hypothetical protein
LVTSTGVTEKLPPLQIVAVIGFITGLGLTVTVTVKVAPGQFPSAADDVGVTVYVAVCDVFVLFVSVPLMFAGLPTLAAPPVMPPVTVGATQL